MAQEQQTQKNSKTNPARSSNDRKKARQDDDDSKRQKQETPKPEDANPTEIQDQDDLEKRTNAVM